MPGADCGSDRVPVVSTIKIQRKKHVSKQQKQHQRLQLDMDLYLCFIDFSKAFDKVRHSDLFDILLRHNYDGKDLRVIRNL